MRQIRSISFPDVNEIYIASDSCLVMKTDVKPWDMLISRGFNTNLKGFKRQEESK